MPARYVQTAGARRGEREIRSIRHANERVRGRTTDYGPSDDDADYLYSMLRAGMETAWPRGIYHHRTT